jgi:hypothetical protein
VFDWFRRYKECRTSAESDLRSGRPSISRNKEMVAKVRTIFRSNRRLTVREIADDCGISVGSCDAISSPKTTGKWRDGDWILHHDNAPAHTSQCARTHFKMRPHTLHNAPAHTSQCARTHFTMCPHTLHNTSAHTSQCVRTHFTMRPHTLHNTPAHTSYLVQQFLTKHGTAQLQQPPYSSDLAQCDFFLFLRLKKFLKGHRFEAKEDIKRNSTKTLLDISKRISQNVSNSCRNVGRSV